MKILGPYHLAIKWLMENYTNYHRGSINELDQNTWNKNWKIFAKYKPRNSNLKNEYKKYFK